VLDVEHPLEDPRVESRLTELLTPEHWALTLPPLLDEGT
jgi:hypothetical protein